MEMPSSGKLIIVVAHTPKLLDICIEASKNRVPFNLRFAPGDWLSFAQRVSVSKPGFLKQLLGLSSLPPERR